MNTLHNPNRRQFIEWMLSSPLALATGAVNGQGYLLEGPSAAAVMDLLDDTAIASPDEARSVFDFERVAAENLSPAHFGYLAGAAGDNSTLRANREAIERMHLRLSRLTGVGTVDTSCELFGEVYGSPLFLCPIGSLGAFHPEAELGAARAAREHRTAMAISTFGSTPIEAVNEARGQPIWFQLYIQRSWQATFELIRRAEDSGSGVLLITVDSAARVPGETSARFTRIDQSDCTACHNEQTGQRQHKPMIAPLTAGPRELSGASNDWDVIARIRENTDMTVVIKGLETAGDAERAGSIGADAVYVSNHGGRTMTASRGALDCLAEVVSGAGRLPVLIDSGFRRGPDVFKALALGAAAVGVGRPMVWGLGAFGQSGVERVIDLINSELRVAMLHTGAKRVSEIDATMLSG